MPSVKRDESKGESSTEVICASLEKMVSSLGEALNGPDGRTNTAPLNQRSIIFKNNKKTATAFINTDSEETMGDVLDKINDPSKVFFVDPSAQRILERGEGHRFFKNRFIGEVEDSDFRKLQVKDMCARDTNGPLPMEFELVYKKAVEEPVAFE